MRGVDSQKYVMDQRRLLSCQKQSCLPVVLNYTLAGAIKQQDLGESCGSALPAATEPCALENKHPPLQPHASCLNP